MEIGDNATLASQLWRGLSEASVPLLLLDEELRVLFASGGVGHLLGMATDQVVGQWLPRFVLPDPGVSPEQMAEQCGDGHPHEVTLRRETGGVVPAEIVCHRFADEAGRVRTLVTLHDLTQIKSIDQDRLARLGKLSLLNQINEALYGARLSLDQVLEAVLHCVTAEQGLRFNRAFLLLVDERAELLKGELAIGPSNSEEAARIWSQLADQQHDLFALMTRYDRSCKQTDVTVNELVRRMTVPVGEAEHILVRSMSERQAFRVVASEVSFPGVDQLRHWLSTAAFAVAPLTTRRGPLGVIVADNLISGKEITDLDLEFLQLLANVSANAIENSQLYQELQHRLDDLRKAARRQKEDQKLLLRMERLSIMGETAAVVAHELRNPLVAIGGFARTLHRSLPESDVNRQYAAIITEEVDRLERIIHDLLDFIRPKKVLRKQIVIDELIADTVRVYESKLGESRIRLALDLQAPGRKVRINPGEIQQVVQNLVVNGIQAMDKGGTLQVRTSVQTSGVKVEIRDEGPGIPDNIKAKLFTPFFSTKPSGSGLGLAISSQIVKGHGGQLIAENRAEGGAVFAFTLPWPKPRPADGGGEESAE